MLTASVLQQASTDIGLAVLFPGQGSQKVGMGKDLYAVSKAAREVFDIADAELGMNLSALCFQGPDDELTRTENAQLAIMATSLACWAAAVEAGTIDRVPAYLAGHSLGEYTALVVAESLRFSDALSLVRLRGRLMQESGTQPPGRMAAILGMSEDQVLEICRSSGAEPCNFNSPSQVVVGGTPESVRRATEMTKEQGGRAIDLRVSGAFHTSLMKKASVEFAAAVDEVAIADPAIPVMSNVTGDAMSRGSEVRDDLKRQMVSPVRWHQSVATMVERGVERFAEIGPGRALSALLKRGPFKVSSLSIDGAISLGSLSNV
jgi:[acyl-carrier-protein] S-malonyltransferase